MCVSVQSVFKITPNKELRVSNGGMFCLVNDCLMLAILGATFILKSTESTLIISYWSPLPTIP